ncbi:hypothetical protein ACU686_32865 [Yinghuangia aomiensis]
MEQAVLDGLAVVVQAGERRTADHLLLVQAQIDRVGQRRDDADHEDGKERQKERVGGGVAPDGAALHRGPR